MNKEKVIVVEDEPDILEVIEYNLQREGYLVTTAHDGLEGLSLVRVQCPDLILLDLMLPGINGIEICRQLKADDLTHHIPIIMVTAKGEESDIVLGLGIGADDYIPKPFSPKELISRVKAVLRRGIIKSEKTGAGRIYRNGLLLDESRFEARLDDQPLDLTVTEFNLLLLLASCPGRVFTRNQLINTAVGENVCIIDRNIDVHIRNLRKKLEEKSCLIETIRGIGYRFHDERSLPD